MSYMRAGHPLRYFNGVSKSYVFQSTCPTRNGLRKIKQERILSEEDYFTFTEDYGDTYRDNCSFAELISTFVYRVTQDKAYSDKIIRVLAKKLKVEHKIREHPLTDKEYSAECIKLSKKFSKSKVYREIGKLLGTIKRG